MPGYRSRSLSASAVSDSIIRAFNQMAR